MYLEIVFDGGRTGTQDWVIGPLTSEKERAGLENAFFETMKRKIGDVIIGHAEAPTGKPIITLATALLILEMSKAMKDD